MGTTTTFSTDGLPDVSRSIRFRDHMKQWFAVDLDLRAPERAILDVQMRGYRAGRLRFASFRFSPHVTRFAGLIEEAPHLLASLLKKGSVEVSQGGRVSRVEAGEMVLIDPSRPFTIDSGEIETLSVYLRPGMVQALDSRIRLMTALPFDANGPAGLFQAIVSEVAHFAPGLEDTQADDMADLLDLGLRSALTAQEKLLGQIEEGAALQRSRIRSFVLANLRAPELSARTIASRLDLSVRRVHQLLAGEEMSLMRWIWSERLKRCRGELRDPRYREVSISEIAFSWGFSDSAHFSRTFRQEYGCSPTEWRQQQSRGMD